MATISQVLDRIKGDLQREVPETLLEGIVHELDLQGRNRVLTPVVTTYLFLQQVLQGNTACADLRHRSGLDFTPSAYCQARRRLPVAFFYRLQRAVTQRLRTTKDAAALERWRGHRTFLIDGSSFSMPDTEELQEAFGQPGAQARGCGFPTAHLLALFDARSGFLLRAIPAPLRTHDLAHAALVHPELQAGDILVGDRAFASYAHLTLCAQRGLHGLFRAHQRQIIDFRPRRRYLRPDQSPKGQAGRPRSRWLRRLGRQDQLVEYFKPKERPAWMSAADYAALPASLIVRELRFRVRLPGRRVQTVTVVTTLLDPRRYPASALALLYGQRWHVEGYLRDLKQTLGMDILRCQTMPGVIKELIVFTIIYNLVRRVMRVAAQRQRVAPQRISFIDALRWLRQARPGDTLPKLVVLPSRPNRVEPRVCKRRTRHYPVMTRPRAVLRQRLAGKAPRA